MQRWKVVLYNIGFALNCLLIFLVIFEERLSVPPWMQVIGRMHPLLVHFPIVLLLLTIFWELVPGRKLHAVNDTNIGDSLLLITSFTAVLTSLMGLLLSKESGYSPEMLTWHKWSGIAVSVCSFGWYVWRKHVRRFRLALALTAITSFVIVFVTGHLGADITHGEDFIYGPVLAEQQSAPVLLDDAEVFAHMVHPIFKAKCAGCHNEKKAKGQLVMSSPDLLLKGGKSGALWDSTESDYGLLLRRIHLPEESKKHMPPLGKPQLTDIETAIISNWIRHGASFKTKVAELPATDSLRLFASTMFSTIETADYNFAPAAESKISQLHNNYRTVMPLATGSPALGVEFFGAAQFKSEQLKELLAVKEQIVSLNLNKIPVTDDDLQTIAQFSNLRRLNLSFTNITGKSLAQLKNLKELNQLSLSGTGVKAADLRSLATLPALSQLYVWSTPVQAENISSLKNVFPRTNIETGFSGDTIKIKLNPPLVENEEQVVLEPLPLKLKHFLKNVSIHYTTDGTEPDSLASPVFNGDFLIDRNMTVKAKAFKPGWISSDVAEKTFFKAGYKIDSIRLLNDPDPKYKSTGAAVLTDGQKGDFNFGNGKWLGYRQQPLEAMILFDSAKMISSITVSNLTDINSYLMPPQEIVVWGGNDPGKLHMLKKINPAQPTKEMPSYIKGYELGFKPESLKYIRIQVKPVAKLPPWHRGKGDKGWAFVDEVFIN